MHSVLLMLPALSLVIFNGSEFVFPVARYVLILAFAVSVIFYIPMHLYRFIAMATVLVLRLGEAR